MTLFCYDCYQQRLRKPFDSCLYNLVASITSDRVPSLCGNFATKRGRKLRKNCLKSAFNEKHTSEYFFRIKLWKRWILKNTFQNKKLSCPNYGGLAAATNQIIKIQRLNLSKLWSYSGNSFPNYVGLAAAAIQIMEVQWLHLLKFWRFSGYSYPNHGDLAAAAAQIMNISRLQLPKPMSTNKQSEKRKLNKKGGAKSKNRKR